MFLIHNPLLLTFDTRVISAKTIRLYYTCVLSMLFKKNKKTNVLLLISCLKCILVMVWYYIIQEYSIRLTQLIIWYNNADKGIQSEKFLLYSAFRNSRPFLNHYYGPWPSLYYTAWHMVLSRDKKGGDLFFSMLH